VTKSRAAEVAIPFAIFTAIWGSTWIVIRDQLGTVPPQWSVAYRFIIASAAMALIARWKGESLGLGRKGLLAALFLGFAQFCVNFNAVYLAERHITSGVVATIFALLLIPSTLLAWAFLGHRPTSRFLWSSLVAIVGIALLFVHEFRQHSSRAWSMAAGALIDIAVALVMTGAPVIDTRPGYWAGVLYLALPATVLTFSLYYPVVRKIGPAKAAYSSVLVPIIAMGFSTALEGYRWTPLTIGGAMLALGGMVGALSRPRAVVAAPDAA
jgi:drug/metabolite transporter (DMT)-like permease